MKDNAKWVLLILLVIPLFFWKILFTHQFSLLTGYEAVGQAYSWYHFSASTVQQGVLLERDEHELTQPLHLKHDCVTWLEFLHNDFQSC